MVEKSDRRQIGALAAVALAMAAMPPPSRDDVFEITARPNDGFPFSDIVDPLTNPFLGHSGPVVISRASQPQHIAAPNPKADRRKLLKVRAMQERKSKRRERSKALGEPHA